MKMTKVLTLGLLSAAAAISLGCEDTPKGQVQYCVDQDYKVTDDQKCDKNVYVPGHTYPFYRWYYSSQGFSRGDLVGGGSWSAADKVPVYRATDPTGSAIVRGGMGHGFAGSVGE